MLLLEEQKLHAHVLVNKIICHDQNKNMQHSRLKEFIAS